MSLAGHHAILLSALVSLALVVAPGHSQVFQAPPANQNQQGDPTGAPPSSTGTGQSQNNSSNNNQIFGDLLPFMNPGSEVVTFNGQNWAVMDQRVFASRFEKYLNAPESTSEEDDAYRETIDQILAKVSPHNPGGPDLRGAVNLLPVASSYPIDAHLCDSLSGAVYAAYLSQKNVGAMGSLNDTLDEQRRQMEWNIEVGGDPSSLDPPKGENGEERELTPEQIALKLGRVSGYIKRAAEIEALKQANRARVQITQAKAKVEFQALIVQFLLQRRFEHVVIGCRLYRALFTDGDSELAVEKNSDVEKLFGQSLGINPTISSLDAFASEAIRDVDEAVDSFRFLVSRQELASASKRLSEAFMIGEYLNKVRTLPREEKRQVLAFVRDSNQLLSALDVRDFGLAEELIDRMRETAKDFDYAKPMAAVTTAKTVSDMELSKAKNAMIRGDQDAMAEAVRNATEVWPTNPKLREVGGLIDQGANVESQALIDFQGLIAQKNYRQIHRDQARYILAVRNDPAKQEELRKILEDVTKIDMVLVQSDKLAESGNRWGAWEIVEQTRSDFPDDSDLNRTRADLSSQVAPFVNALDRAKQLEDSDQLGSSLAWFLKAKQIYPNSSFANDGINRLVDQILPEGNQDQASAN